MSLQAMQDYQAKACQQVAQVQYAVMDVTRLDLKVRQMCNAG